MMLSGQPPFDGRDNAEIMEAVKAGQYSTFEIRGVSDLAQDLLSRLLEMDPDERLTAADALKHPWFDIRNEVGDEDAAARPLPNIVPHISKFNRMCRLKRACMSLVAFDMSDKDVRHRSSCMHCFVVNHARSTLNNWDRREKALPSDCSCF